ncbi:hypothetical protein [Rhodoferax sp.]|uniref:hypothetical protein n=1 Tax=Rhodoferax sp. TaxID=50421 RepID=UPI00261E1700|nr:hypothetical protein [Rhodoferax sp.]MDD2924745.1 hypothetical protein [Rhodoferax sp.]
MNIKPDNILMAVMLAAATCAAPVHAELALRDTVELNQLLKKEPPCCVIDARSVASQRQHPLAEALSYHTGMTIIPTASVVVVADDDKNALRIGAILAKQHPGKMIHAVKGGAVAWEIVLRSLEKVSSSKASGTAAGISFVIPHNTCETGTPLQVLSSKPGSQPKP